MWNGKKVGGGKLPGAAALVVQGKGRELEAGDEDGLWELENVDEDVEMFSGEAEQAGAEQELKMARKEAVTVKGCMGKVSRVMRQYWQMWA